MNKSYETENNINETENEFEEKAKKIIEETLAELERRGRVKKPSEKTPYQRTETLLHNLNGFYEGVEFHKRQIELLQLQGAPKKSKSITSYVANSGLRENKDEIEIIAEKIEDERKVIYRTELLLGIVENALSELPENRAPEIIDLIYRDKMNLLDVAEEVGLSHPTVTKNKRILVNLIATRLFPDECIKEIIY